MKCVLFNPSVKVLSRAIHSLARIGDDLVIEPFKDGFKLSTLDKSEAAYSQFWFPVSFFYSYQYDNNENADDLRLKISFKAFLTVFKTCHSVDKIAQSCTIRIEKDIPAIIIKIQFTAGYSKTHKLFVSDCLPINANCSTPNRNEIVLSPKVLSNALRNFQIHQSEITLSVDSRKTVIHNFDDETLEAIGQNIRSQLSLDAGEFDTYRIGVDTAILFTVREVKAMLAFAEHVASVIKIMFDESPKPIIFNISDEGKFEAHYILATDASRTTNLACGSSSDASGSVVPRALARHPSSDISIATRGHPLNTSFPASPTTAQPTCATSSPIAASLLHPIRRTHDELSGGNAKRRRTNDSRVCPNEASTSRAENNNDGERVNHIPDVGQAALINEFGSQRLNDSSRHNSSMNKLRTVDNVVDQDIDDLSGNLNVNDDVVVIAEDVCVNVQNVSIRNSSLQNSHTRNNKTIPTNVNNNSSSSSTFSSSKQKEKSSTSSSSNNFNQKFSTIENILFGGNRQMETKERPEPMQEVPNGQNVSNRNSVENVGGLSVSYGKDDLGDDNVIANLGNDKARSRTDKSISRLEKDTSEVFSEFNGSKQNDDPRNRSILSNEASNCGNTSQQSGNQSNHSNSSKQNGNHRKQASICSNTSQQKGKHNALQRNKADSSSSLQSSNSLESFDPADFQPVLESDGDSQETTVMNVYTPLDPDKLRIVFQHCIKTEGKEIIEGLNEVEREGGRVLVFSSDDESS